MCWVIPSGPGECSSPAKQDFCQRMLLSYSEPHCPVLGGAATKERISKKTQIFIYYIHGANQGFVGLLLAPGCGEQVWLGKLLWVLGAMQTSLCLDGPEKLWVAEYCLQSVGLSALDLAKMMLP